MAVHQHNQDVLGVSEADGPSVEMLADIGYASTEQVAEQLFHQFGSFVDRDEVAIEPIPETNPFGSHRKRSVFVSGPLRGESEGEVAMFAAPVWLNDGIRRAGLRSIAEIRQQLFAPKQGNLFEETKDRVAERSSTKYSLPTRVPKPVAKPLDYNNLVGDEHRHGDFTHRYDPSAGKPQGAKRQVPRARYHRVA